MRCSCAGGPQTWSAEAGQCLQGRSQRCPASFMEAESTWEPCQRQCDPFYRPVDSCPHAVLQCTETPSPSKNQNTHTHQPSSWLSDMAENIIIPSSFLNRSHAGRLGEDRAFLDLWERFYEHLLGCKSPCPDVCYFTLKIQCSVRSFWILNEVGNLMGRTVVKHGAELDCVIANNLGEWKNTPNYI